MFNKLKEKLKSWFSKSKETIEEKAEAVEKPAEKTEEQPEKKPVSEKQIEKAEKLIEKAKQEPSEKIPTKFDVAKRGYKPDLEKVQAEAETIKKEVEKAEIKEREIKEFEEEVEKAKQELSKSIPTKFDTGKQKYEPDLEKIKEEITEKTIFQKIKSTFSYKISEAGFNEIFDDLEFLLLENNAALEVVENIRKKLAEKLIGKEVPQNKVEGEIRQELKNVLNEILIEPDNPLDIIKISKKPFVILFFGINGTGKTTSIAKIAYFLKKAGLKVVLAASDTFRAASIEQLNEHAKKLDIVLIKHDYGADPAAVGFDAIKYAKAHKIDVVLIDTAGRMHTKANLIEEMKKIERVTKPDLKLFVAESIAGNDAVEQAKTFNEAIEIDGTILSKADIDEKGGTIISVSYATKKPIFYLGVGQGYEDLELFNKQKFIESLLG